MRIACGLLALLLLGAIPAFAQTPKEEISLSGTFSRYSAPSGYDLDMAGWMASGSYNLKNWLGVEFEPSGNYSNKALLGWTSTYRVLVGPQFFPFRHHKLTPWGHFLFGESYYQDSIPPTGGFPAKVNSDFAFAWEAGAGVDVNIKKRWGARLQFDYDPTRFFGDKPGQPDYRVSFGFIYRIGKK
jgi:Outer membrane protein beta-barrel domain